MAPSVTMFVFKTIFKLLPALTRPLHTRTHSLTMMSSDSMAALPDFWNGRGMGWAIPFSSMVRQRRVYSPADSPGNSVAQWIFVNRIGQNPLGDAVARTVRGRIHPECQQGSSRPAERPNAS